MKTEKYQRKPFVVDAVRVTRDNLEEVAKWCNGELKAVDGQEPYVYVRVAMPISERSKQAFVGDWVVYMSATGFKVFRHKSFKKNFESVFKDIPERTIDEMASVQIDSDAPDAEAIVEIFTKATDEDPGVEQSIPGPNQDIIDTLGSTVVDHPANPIQGNAFTPGPVPENQEKNDG